MFITLLALVAALQSPAPKLSITHLSGDFYIFTTHRIVNGAPFPSNGMYVVTRDGVVMIDTPWDVEQTGPLLDSIERRHGRRVVLCIATHYHDDRTGGLDILKSRGVRTYASEQTWRLAHEKGEREPEFRFGGDTTFTVGGVRFRTYYPGQGQTRDNIVIWFPKGRVLYGGCLVKSSEAPGLGNLADANVERWPATIRNVMRAFGSPRFIIPGHQSWRGTKALKDTLDLLRKAGYR